MLEQRSGKKAGPCSDFFYSFLPLDSHYVHAGNTGNFAHLLDLFEKERDSLFGLVPLGTPLDAFNDLIAEW